MVQLGPEPILMVIKGILSESLKIFNDSSLYLLFGFLVAGLLHVFFPEERIFRHLGGKRYSSVLKASLLGVPLPLCSCGVVPTALSLKKQGASDGATLSFLISTPETGVDSIAVTYALLGPVFTIFRPMAAFFSAVVAGLLVNFSQRKEKETPAMVRLECAVCTLEKTDGHQHNLSEKVNRVVDYAFSEFLREIALWFLIAILIAGVISYIIPERALESYLGKGLFSMVVMLLIGIPVYVCASASTPIAAALLLKGLNPGAALVFLLAGPATNAATVVMVARYLGRKIVVIYLVTIAASAVLMGLLLNQVFSFLGIAPQAGLATGGELIPFTVKVISSSILGALILLTLFRRVGPGHTDECH